MRQGGFLNINKPQGLTSHDVVARVRRGLKIKKVGHAGTLDPMATGVLIVCVGAATRLSEYVMHTTKTYVARVRLGVTTDTYDAEGEVIAQQDASHITAADVERVLPMFRGEIAQVPPMYSAIKMGGQKLYDLARAGREVERAPRSVTIHALAVTAWALPDVTLSVTCSSGTYIRSLAYDIGEQLGVGAHLTALERTASGVFALDGAVTLDTLFTDAAWQRHLIAPEAALAHLPVVTFTAEQTLALTQGRFVPHEDEIQPDSIAQARNADGRFFAIVKAAPDRWLPHKVFNAGVE